MNASTQRLAQSLSRTLAENNLLARLQRPILGPRTTTLPITLASSSDLPQVERLADRAALRADVESVRIVRNRGRVLVEYELPRGQWRPVGLRQGGQGLQQILGISSESKPIGIDFGKPGTAHALVVGGTGSGKTTLVRALLWQAVRARPEDLKLVLIDAKRELADFRYLPHTMVYASDGQASAEALAWVAAQLDARTPSSTPWLVVVDELAATISGTKGASEVLARIAQLGRSLHVHLLCGTQNADQKTLGNPAIRANILVRLCGKVENASQSALALGLPDLGAHRLSGTGDFVLNASGKQARFQAPILTADQVRAMGAAPAPSTAESDQAGPREEWTSERPAFAAEHVAWVLSRTSDGQTPSREKIRTGLELGGSARAAALKGYCQAIVDEWHRLEEQDTEEVNESE